MSGTNDKKKLEGKQEIEKKDEKSQINHFVRMPEELVEIEIPRPTQDLLTRTESLEAGLGNQPF